MKPAEGYVNGIQSGLQRGILPLLKPSPCLNRKKKTLCIPKSPRFSPSSLTSLQSLWLILADRGPVGREGWEGKEGGGKKLYIPKKLSSKCAGATVFPRGGCSLPGLPGGVWRKERLLYASRFRKVGDESYHHPHVHSSAYSDGEGGEE